jgi:hypothetical protein
MNDPKDWTDKEFLDYVEIHSKTERALFSPTHVNRFMNLIGSTYWTDAFDAMHYNEIKVPLERAFKSLEKIK